MEKIKIIIDTNIWISFLFGGSIREKLKMILNDDRFELVFSDELMTEISSVLARPKFQKYIKPIHVQMLIETILLKATFIDVTQEVKVSRDKKDDFLLALCLDGDADFLTSGDKDLLVLQQFGKTKILTISDFYNHFFE